MAELDFTKMMANKHVTVWLGLTGGASGIQKEAEPSADELNNTGGTSGVVNATAGISWNDYDFGTQDAETSSDPSLADGANFEDLGAAQWGGNMSFYMPGTYDDSSSLYSTLYDLTDTPWTNLDIATRIDGHKTSSTAAADGDFVSVYRTWTDEETNSMEPGEAIRRTVGFKQRDSAAFYTIVGDHAITTVIPANPWVEGTKGRIQGVVQDRDYTSALTFHSSAPDVVTVYPGGFYKVTGESADTATITITDEATGDNTTISVTVTS